MNTSSFLAIIAVASALVLLLGLWLMLAGRSMPQRLGLGSGQTLSLDRVTVACLYVGFDLHYLLPVGREMLAFHGAGHGPIAFDAGGGVKDGVAAHAAVDGI